MEKNSSRFSKILYILCFSTLLFGSVVYAAGLDDLYTPLLSSGKKLYKSDLDYYEMGEKGQHGSASFGAFDSEPQYFSFRQHLRFSPINLLEIGLGYGMDLPASYNRTTYNPAGSVAFFNQYDLDFIHHMNFDLRRRFSNSEFYIDGYINRQRASWNSAPGLVVPNFFTLIHSHYEDIKTGFRYLSSGQNTQDRSNLSKVTHSLLEEGQFNWEAELGYKRGNLIRDNEFLGTVPPTTRTYRHHLRPHLIPRIGFRYGLDENLEFQSGLSYKPPMRFKFEFKQFTPSLSTTNFIIANYKVEKEVNLPLKLIYRPRPNVEISLLSNTTYGVQTLNSYEKETEDTITNFPKKRLRYLNTAPTFKLTYLYEAGKQNMVSEFRQLTKNFLAQNQLLVDFQYQKDITHLRKNGANGTQNIIDPETLFFYPLDNFIAGTEYAAFLAGNSSLNTTDVHPQNFHRVEMNLKYGVRDNFNAGLGVGYQSGSGVHQFTYADLASRFYRFEPHYFFNFLADLQLTDNSLLTFKLHYVPWYKTFMRTDIHPEEFEVTTDYVQTAFSFQILF